VEAARVAWRYFERNTDARSGLTGSVEGFPSSTLWDMGSSLYALLAARGVGLLTQRELDARAAATLAGLARLPLTDRRLPNKAYHAETLAMTDYANRPSARGIGTSALDVARLVSALEALACLHPQHREAAAAVVSRWDACALAQGGELQGFHLSADGRRTERGQEGRFGYAQYAGRVLGRLGLPTSVASSYRAFRAETPVEGVRVPHDTRTFQASGAHGYVLTEPWALSALELGQDAESRPLLRRILDVQRARWKRTGQVTAVTEDHVDRPPHFVYNTILTDGQPWKALTDTGEDQDALRTVSVKAAFALSALFPSDPYARLLRQSVAGAFEPEKGWYAGLYERGGAPNRALTANTNGVVLESVLYGLHGPLLQACRACGAGRARPLLDLAAACPEGPAPGGR
jgi:hypothetical protein